MLHKVSKRLETIALKLWEMHGSRQIGFWTALTLKAFLRH